MKKHQDKKLDQKIEYLHKEVERWARKHELWFDCGFFDYTERVNPMEWDETGYVTVLAADGPMSDVAMSRDSMGLSEEFDLILQKNGFWYENRDHTEMWIYAIDPDCKQEFKEYMHWKWICSLIKPDFDILDQEIYAQFGAHPEQLHDLHWRDFEKMVAALLESQGYQVELGPGSNDEGIDIRLLQRNLIGDILTLVQVKRYAPHREIRLEAVQALHGAAMADADGAAKSLFVTTSAYAPSAKRFAARRNVPMMLHTSSDVQQWCIAACNGIVEDKRRLVSEEHVTRALEKARLDNHQILHSCGGYDMVTNQFALVLKETCNASLLLELRTQITADDGYGQRGYEIPDLRSVPPLSNVGVNGLRRARRKEGGISRKFWDGTGWYSPWNGNPVYFDHRD